MSQVKSTDKSSPWLWSLSLKTETGVAKVPRDVDSVIELDPRHDLDVVVTVAVLHHAEDRP